ncbi:MAG: RecQ family ATP-dependent DNA helicase [Balneola sp.]
MKDVLFIDIETDRNGKIQDYGALFNGKELHEKHSTRLETWISQATTICGHNILAHDIPYLKKILGDEVFQEKSIIDTLLWSPLIFSENPYHRLVKGYKLVNDTDANNPLSDCKLTKELLLDELEGFRKQEDVYQKILGALLANQPNFYSFLRLGSFRNNEKELLDLVNGLLKDKMCQSVDLEHLIASHPVELAYVLAILRFDNNESILPSWVRLQYPNSEIILDKLRFTVCGQSECSYCSKTLDPKSALQTYFGYTDFRKFDENRNISLQEDTVRAGLQDQSFVAVFPTGGGKSLTFQLPALMRGDGTRHLTVVISPLVSLMKDQVDNLQDRFQITKAVAINGLLSPLERKEVLERVEKGGAHLVYLSPESLRSPTILRLLSSRSIARFVIDEAHCFSSWGQDFRVDYLYIAEFIKKLQTENRHSAIPVSCFTATAKPQVINDIKEYFNSRLGLELKEFVTQKGRTNLSYEVIKTENSENKKQKLFSLLEICEKPAIIYASRTKTVEEVASSLKKAGMPATYFHGKLDKDEKKKNMDAFMAGDSEIIVATSAFGMGVDKEDVRTVVHYNISDSLENYIQEAGRAGRKESIEAKCYILYNASDLNKHFSLLQQTKLNKKEIEEIWKSLRSQVKNRSKISQSALEIAKAAGWDTEIRELETRVTTAISALEDRGFLKRDQNSPRVFADSLLVKTFMSGQTLIQASVDITGDDKKDCERILKRIITDKETRLDYLADRTGMHIRRVQECIQSLRNLKILGDSKDLTAFVSLVRSKNGSKEVATHHMKIEKALLDWSKDKTRISISLRQLNQKIIDDYINESTIDGILRILNYWEIRGFISKSRTDREKEIYEIRIKKPEVLIEDIGWRHTLLGNTLGFLLEIAEQTQNQYPSNDQIPVRFSLIELVEKISLFGQVIENKTWRYEKTLLFLNQIKSIKLEGGFMVSYNKLNIEQIKAKEKPLYKVDDYAKMEAHYQHKTEQIHIVGEYAKKCVENYDSALAYVNDYFTLEYEEFLARYFPRRISEIRRPLTPERFKEVIRDLDTDQTKVLSDSKSNHIMVLAGPGSGKTKLLVHKIASLLLLEDIKPEQFLMLTFSKSASLEFRYRTRKLVPEFAGLIKITTFHGFCFELLGQLGDLVKSKNVIQECINGINAETIDSTMIANKSVLLLDEFQDINKEEWELIKTIINVAGNIRVIAVGDDDQNIYGFRGSSNAYMQNFKQKYQATQYSLVKNYRSRSGIIQFNNQMLSHIPNRLKSEELVPARRTLKARIQRTQYRSINLVEPLVQSIPKDEGDGTKAILVRTNYEALLVSSRLEELGHKTRLLAGYDGFSLAQLDEVRFLTNQLKQRVNDSGLIFDEDWKDSLRLFKARFYETLHYSTCIEIFKKFHQAYPDRKLLVDWYEYVRQIKMEDAINADASSIIVSTMHKAKGKEFNHVWLLLEDYSFTEAEAKRLVYVACSRAKDSLFIHTNTSFFNGIEVDELKVFENKESTYPPSYYELILSHKDVNLSSQKFSRARNIIQKLSTGEVLVNDSIMFGDNEAPGLAKNGTGNMLLFSRDFIKKKLIPFKEKGYIVKGANVEYLVYWYDREEDKEYKVVLPKLRFERIE